MEETTWRRRVAVAASVVAFAGFGAAGCGDDNGASEDIEDAAENGANEVEEAAGDASDAADEATDDAGDALDEGEDAADDAEDEAESETEDDNGGGY